MTHLNQFTTDLATQNLTDFQFNTGPDLCLVPSSGPKVYIPTLISDRPAPTSSKQIKVVDVYDNALPNVNIQTRGIRPTTGVITNSQGYATLSDVMPDEVIIISHVGKETIQTQFKNLGSLITLQDKALVNEEVVITATSEKTTQEKPKKVKFLPIAIGLGLLWGISAYASSRPEKKKGKKGKKKTVTV